MTAPSGSGESSAWQSETASGATAHRDSLARHFKPHQSSYRAVAARHARRSAKMFVYRENLHAFASVGQRDNPQYGFADLPAWRSSQVTTGLLPGSKKSLMRICIERSIAYWDSSGLGTQRTSLDSLLGVGCPLRARAVSTIENS